MRTRLVAALAAGALTVASLATVATHAAGGEPEPLRTPPTERTAERRPPAEATTRPRVPPGVLARAASRRAQQREAESPPAPERRRGREGNIISIEIDWNAGTAER